MCCVREGCTAVVEVQQASTDICSFFNQAYVLSAGEVVYHGGANEQAMAMLGGSGMPCPPLYHPIEQYMRLIDPSFEVSMTVPICTKSQATLSNPSLILSVSTAQAGIFFFAKSCSTKLHHAALPLCVWCLATHLNHATGLPIKDLTASFALHACVAMSIILADNQQH